MRNQIDDILTDMARHEEGEPWFVTVNGVKTSLPSAVDLISALSKVIESIVVWDVKSLTLTCGSRTWEVDAGLFVSVSDLPAKVHYSVIVSRSLVHAAGRAVVCLFHDGLPRLLTPAESYGWAFTYATRQLRKGAAAIVHILTSEGVFEVSGVKCFATISTDHLRAIVHDLVPDFSSLADLAADVWGELQSRLSILLDFDVSIEIRKCKTLEELAESLESMKTSDL